MVYSVLVHSAQYPTVHSGQCTTHSASEWHIVHSAVVSVSRKTVNFEHVSMDVLFHK